MGLEKRLKELEDRVTWLEDNLSEHEHTYGIAAEMPLLTTSRPHRPENTTDPRESVEGS